jgi:NTP pyrophosphatase (non-canonical NTP hydrolase)
MMGKSLAEMTAEIRQINIDHGWRPADGGPGDRTFGDFIALLHSEVSEALEAYRDHRLADATKPICGNEGHTGNPCPEHGMGKPEGAGSELADVLIRLLDMCDVFGVVPFDMDCELADVEPMGAVFLKEDGFGALMSCLHEAITDAYRLVPPVKPYLSWSGAPFAKVLRLLVRVSEECGVDLTAEVERKMAYNRTRPFRHGGRNL